MTYNISQLERIFEEISNIITFFEKGRVHTRRTQIFLAGADKIDYCVPASSVPHLLGINTNYLQSTGLFKNKNSYGILKELINKGAYWLYTQSKNIKLDNVFSSYTAEKVSSFRDNIEIEEEKILFIACIDRDTIHNQGRDIEPYDYIIVKKTINGDYTVLCLTRNGYECIPSSNQLYKNETQLDAFLTPILKGQRITFITGKRKYNTEIEYNKSFNLSSENKIKIYYVLKANAEKYGAIIDVSRDYSFCLQKYIEYLEKYKGTSETEVASLTKISDSKTKRIKELEELVEQLQQQLTSVKEDNDRLVDENVVGKAKILEIKRIVENI